MSTVFQKEAGSCNGRGFGVGELLSKFLIWVVKAPGAGGPQWYLWDDQSGLGTDPYVVVCDTAAPTVNDYNTGPSGGAPKFLKVGFLTSEATVIRISAYMWWDNGTQTGYGLWTQLRLSTVDSGAFAYDFRGGAECMSIVTRVGTVYSQFIIDDFVGDANYLEAASVVAVIPGLTSPGSSVVVPMSGGDEALFTAGNYYYIYNFNSEHHVEYVKVTAIGAGSITIETITASFAAGSVIGAYPHRYYAMGSGYQFGVTDLNSFPNKLPYCSSKDQNYVFHNQTGWITGGSSAAWLAVALWRLNPDEDGKYSIQELNIVEYYRENNYGGTTDMNRIYGKMKNIIMAYNNSYMQGVATRIVGGKTYLYFVTASSMMTPDPGTFAIFTLDTTSLV